MSRSGCDSESHDNLCNSMELKKRRPLSEIEHEMRLKGIKFYSYTQKRYIERHPRITELRGTNLDLVDLLGDYLVTNDPDRPWIETEELVGKYVVLFACDPLETGYSFDPNYPEDITHVDLEQSYYELKARHNPIDTEVVFVPSDVFSTEDVFTAWFSKMPWVSVPFESVTIRKDLISTFGRRWIILDPAGKVLQTQGHYIFHYFGAEAYPFTISRIRKIRSKDFRLRKGGPPSFNLQALLGHGSRKNIGDDFLLCWRRDGTIKVPISILEGKMIGLLFIDICRHCYVDNFVDTLKKIYNEVKERSDLDVHDFQIVFVPLPLFCECRKEGGQKFFKDNFAQMPWFALPFDDQRCRKLWRIFGSLDKVYQDDDEVVTFDRVLVIVGPHGKFVELSLGAVNMIRYGVEGYPFTQERAAEIEKARLEAFTLDSYFKQAANCNFRNRDGVQASVADLYGKQVLVIFAPSYSFKHSEFLRKLKTLYAQNKGTDDEFEVIHMALECSQTSYGKCCEDMPWLMYPYNRRDLYMLAGIVFEKLKMELPGLLAFGRDGKFLTRQKSLVDPQVMNPEVFPFVEVGNLRQQIIEGFLCRHWLTCYGRRDCY